MNVYEKIVEPSVCEVYKNIIEEFWFRNGSSRLNYQARLIDITGDPIVKTIENFLNSRQSTRVQAGHVELMAWPAGTYSPLHVHKDGNRHIFPYHSVLYLNDDYEGGEFYTPDQTRKMSKGSLTFFDGQKLMHGVMPVTSGHRWTINFWWFKDIFPTFDDAVKWIKVMSLF